MDTYNGQDQFKTSLLCQLKQVSESRPPTGPNSTLVKNWWAANLREKLLILQCVLRYSSGRFDVDDMVDILKVSMDRSDGPMSDDAELEALHFSVLRLHSALLVKILNIRHSDREMADIRRVTGTVEEELSRLSHRPEYSPVLLAWMLLHYTRASETAHASGGSKAQLFGEKAVSQRVLKIVADIANDPVIHGESPLRDIVCSALHDVVHVLIDAFDTERLASPTDLRSAAAALLRCGGPRVLEDFWQFPDNGLRLVWNECASQFPVEAVTLLQLAKAVAQSGPTNGTKVNLISKEFNCSLANCGTADCRGAAAFAFLRRSARSSSGIHDQVDRWRRCGVDPGALPLPGSRPQGCAHPSWISRPSGGQERQVAGEDQLVRRGHRRFPASPPTGVLWALGYQAGHPHSRSKDARLPRARLSATPSGPSGPEPSNSGAHHFVD